MSDLFVSRRAAGSGLRIAAVGGAVLVVAAAVVVGVGLNRGDSALQGPTPPPLAAGPGTGGAHGTEQHGTEQHGGNAPGPSRAAEALTASAPQRIEIPSLGVSSSLERLGKGASGQMETPRDPGKAGWYTPGPTPGAAGPAVIAGHVTWNGKQSVFFRLSTLKSGDRIEVLRRDGRTAVFTVDRMAQYPKDRFPTLEVYRNVDHAALRLITCGGEYSQADHRYADNVVVYASLTGSHR